jgi:hypothetical protein
MIYLLLRAVYVPLLHDSIATFFRYVHIHEVWPYYSEWSANNHFLNSLLMLGSYELFGSSPFALKLPNLIFFPVYFYFTWRIAGRISQPMLKWGFLVSMLFCHNFLEFFGTGRGYGMSLGLVMGAVWFTLQAMDRKKMTDFITAFIFLIMATYANLTIMNSFIIMAGLMLLSVFVYKQSSKLSKISVILILGLVPIILLVILLFRIKAEGELYYGKPDGFLEVSVVTLGKLLTGSKSMAFVWTAVGLYLLTLVIFIIKQIENFKNQISARLLDARWLFFYLVTGNIIASILENKIFGINYPEDRTGLYFYPWLTGAVFYALDQLAIKKRWVTFLPALPFLFFPVHFFINMNLSWSSMENQAIPERFLEAVQSDHQTGTYPPTVQGYQGRVMRWAYMNYRERTELGRIHFEGYPALEGDYQIAEIEDHPEWLTYYDSLDTDRHSGLSLLKRKIKLKRHPVYQDRDIRTPGAIQDEFFEWHRGTVDSLAGQSLYIGYTLDIYADEDPFHGWVVCTVYDKENETVRYEFVPFDWYRTSWSHSGKPFTNGMLIHELPENAESMVIYIWNIRKKQFGITEGQMDIFTLQKD